MQQSLHVWLRSWPRTVAVVVVVEVATTRASALCPEAADHARVSSLLVFDRLIRVAGLLASLAGSLKLVDDVSGPEIYHSAEAAGRSAGAGGHSVALSALAEFLSESGAGLLASAGFLSESRAGLSALADFLSENAISHPAEAVGHSEAKVCPSVSEGFLLE